MENPNGGGGRAGGGGNGGYSPGGIVMSGVLLSAAVLIFAVSYLVAVSPPTELLPAAPRHYLFLFGNTVAFTLSVGVVVYLSADGPRQMELVLALVCLMFIYFFYLLPV